MPALDLKGSRLNRTKLRWASQRLATPPFFSQQGTGSAVLIRVELMQLNAFHFFKNTHQEPPAGLTACLPLHFPAPPPPTHPQELPATNLMKSIHKNVPPAKKKTVDVFSK